MMAIESLMKIPLGAVLLAAVPFPEPRPETRKLHELIRKAIAQADIASEALAGRKVRATVAQ